MSSIDEIAKLKIEPLDDRQIEDEDMEDGTRDIKIITYNDMANIECLDCLFDKHDYIIMLKFNERYSMSATSVYVIA